jgi:predicted aspartyl protease
MKSQLLNRFKLKFRPTVLVAAAVCTASLSAPMLIGSARAETAVAQASPNEPSQKATVEVHGQKVPEGPHCIYMNWATLPVRSADGLLLIKTRLNGDAATMIADTGRLHTEVALDEAERLGLKLTHSKITGTDANGDATATYATFVDDVSLDKFFWHGVKLGVVPHVAQSYSALAGADILLNGLYKDVEFSLAARQIKFFVPSAECSNAFLAYWDENASTVPLVDLSPQDPRQVVTVEVNGKKMTALIDSGSPTSMINLEAAARVGITPQSAGVAELADKNGVGKQHGKAWLASFESFSIGGETIKNPKIGIADLWGPVPPDAFSDLQSGLRLMSINPSRSVAASSGGGSGVSGKVNDGLAQMAPVQSEILTGDRPDMLLGADFLRSHRVLLAISQRRMYYSYLGGKVFDNGDDDAAEKAQARMETMRERFSLNP